jgi:prepilin-type N-terminal cleavage/methylation domain-containing protein
MKNLRNSKGFTLIELMIVVVIIGILAAIAIPKFSQVSKSAKESEADGILKQVYTLEQSYYQRYDTYTDGTNLTTVGWDAGQNAKYYTFTLAGGQNTFTATATPITAGVVCTKTIDNTRTITRAAGCT